MHPTRTETRQYQFTVAHEVPLADINEALDLALLAIQATDGTPRLRLDLRFVIDDARRAVEIDADTMAGQRLAQIFAGLLEAAHGSGSFHIQRIGGHET